MPGMWNMVSEMFVGGPYEHRGSSSLTPGQTMLVMDILFLRSSIRISYRDGANSVRVHSVTFICPPMGGNNG
jgi:hypothetical protein